MNTLEEFNKWVREGLEKGFVQELDKQFRKQYMIAEDVPSGKWNEAKEHFSE